MNLTMRSKRMCGARTRRGTSCQCKALANGRCRLHGGLSSGPKTPEGRARALAALRRGHAAWLRCRRSGPAKTQKEAEGGVSESALSVFIDDLQAGKKLCVLPVPRLLIEAPLEGIDSIRFYPAGTLDIGELRMVSYPAYELREFDRRGTGHLGWVQSGATNLSPDDLAEQTLAAFTLDVDWERFLAGDHTFHLDLIRTAAERAEAALDVIRFESCRLDLPETLPGRAGTFDLKNPFSAALFYTLDDHESYIVGGQVVTHLLTAGLGLEISAPPSIRRIGTGEVGNIARHGLRMLSAAMEANTATSKFVQCVSLLDFLAFPGEYKAMKKAKKEIAVHVARSTKEYDDILEDIRKLIGKKVDNVEHGLRTRIVHYGDRLEDLEPDAKERSKIFLRLQRYIGATLQNLIDMSDQTWPDVVKYRQARKDELQGGAGET